MAYIFASLVKRLLCPVRKGNSVKCSSVKATTVRALLDPKIRNEAHTTRQIIALLSSHNLFALTLSQAIIDSETLLSRSKHHTIIPITTTMKSFAVRVLLLAIIALFSNSAEAASHVRSRHARVSGEHQVFAPSINIQSQTIQESHASSRLSKTTSHLQQTKNETFESSAASSSASSLKLQLQTAGASTTATRSV